MFSLLTKMTKQLPGAVVGDSEEVGHTRSPLKLVSPNHGSLWKVQLLVSLVYPLFLLFLCIIPEFLQNHGPQLSLMSRCQLVCGGLAFPTILVTPTEAQKMILGGGGEFIAGHPSNALG